MKRESGRMNFIQENVASINIPSSKYSGEAKKNMTHADWIFSFCRGNGRKKKRGEIRGAGVQINAAEMTMNRDKDRCQQESP